MVFGTPGFRNIGLFKKKIGISGCRNSGLTEDFRNIGLSELRALGIAGCRTIGFSEYRVNTGFIYTLGLWSVALLLLENINKLFYCLLIVLITLHSLWWDTIYDLARFCDRFFS